MIRQRAAAALCVAALAVTVGCGGESERDSGPAPTPPSPAARTSDEGVIRAWADALRSGDIGAASEFFGLPATAANGTAPITLGAREDVIAFNSSLPCGARLDRTVTRGRYTVGVFKLTERPGGDCGPGTGGEAATAFRIRDGKIVEWLRVSVPPARGGPDRRAPEPGAPPPPSSPPGPSETT